MYLHEAIQVDVLMEDVRFQDEIPHSQQYKTTQQSHTRKEKELAL